jgi:hypothetical protein
MKSFIFATCVGVALLSAGCKDDDRSKSSTGAGAPTATAPASVEHADAGHARLPIGETTHGNLKLVATMDAPVKPGGESAFDVVITGGKPKAVRFWVGTETGEGSVKAKAEEETPDNWHTHAEVPDPLPAGSKFWVEVEPPTGESFKASFDLKVQ